MTGHTPQDTFYCRGFCAPAPPAGPGPDWSAPGELHWPDAVLRRAYCDSNRAYYRAEPDGFLLAYLYSPRAPFPLLPLFCFARLQPMAGRCYLVFSFDREGRPRFGAP